MTPKEKAIELVEKYQSGYTIDKFNYQFWNDLRDAKQCALIAVDEVLKSIDWDYYEGSSATELNWWKEVKQEIEKL